MSHSPMTPEDVSKVYEKVSEDSGKFKERIEKNAMSHEEIQGMIERNYSADRKYPELASVEEMTGMEFAELYKKVAEDVKSSPEEFKTQAEQMGMTPDELSDLFERISGGIQKYPEVWESKEHAQLLNPKNLAMLASALKEDTVEALEHIKGFGKE